MDRPPEDRRARGRVAVVFQGDSTDPSAWSGAPAGLSRGLAEAGAEPFAVDARMRGASTIARALRMEWYSEVANPAFASLGSRRADRALRSAAPIDAAVVLGAGFSVHAPVPVATFDDMTVVQALAQPGSEYEGVGRRQARRWRERQLRNFRRARACCVAGEWAARSVREDYGIDPGKVHVVGFGPNSPRREALERDWSTPRFAFIGVDWERKQGQAVLDAFAEVRRRHPEATLELIGGHPPVQEPGMIGHGMLPLDSAEGRRLHAEVLARATCLVLPSKFEPFGIAYVDAAAAGVPSIGTSNGGAADAIGDGGILIDPADLQGLCRAMLELSEPGRAGELGRRAFAHSAGLSWQGVAERILSAMSLT
jgi:hypothetical protein